MTESMPVLPALLPGPFCGGRDLVLEGGLWVTCRSCNAMGPSTVDETHAPDEEGIRQAWNARSPRT